MCEDGWEESYTVFEEVPPQKEKKERQGSSWIFEFLPGGDVDGRYDPRPSTLKIDLESVTVHKIKEVHFSTKDDKVYRHRKEKQISKKAKHFDSPDADFNDDL